MSERCGAKRRNGTPCQQFPLKGKRRCRLHGGKTPSGADLPQYKHGRYCRVLPSNILAKYEAANEDPDLLTHRDEIKLMDAHLGERLESLKTGSGADISDSARHIWKRFLAAKGKEKTKVLAEMHRLLTGEGTDASWEEVREVVLLRKTLLEAETKRLKDIDGVMRLEESLAMITFLNDAIQRGVYKFVTADVGRQIITTIKQDFARLVGCPIDRPARPRSALIELN